jgi:hypothetical protein
MPIGLVPSLRIRITIYSATIIISIVIRLLIASYRSELRKSEKLIQKANPKRTSIDKATTNIAIVDKAIKETTIYRCIDLGMLYKCSNS